MDLRQCRRYPEMEAGHQDQDVRRAAYLLAQLRLQPFVVLAVGQLTLSPGTPVLTRNLQSLARGHALSPEQEAAAFELLSCCHAIATKPDHPGPSIRRGAFLERLVIELLLYRGVPRIEEEISFRFAARAFPCLEVVGITDPLFEVFECKSFPDDLEPGTFAMLHELVELAEAEVFPKEIVPVIATLFPAEDLADSLWRREITVPPGIFQATLENILGLSVGRAITLLN